MSDEDSEDERGPELTSEVRGKDDDAQIEEEDDSLRRKDEVRAEANAKMDGWSRSQEVGILSRDGWRIQTRRGR